MESQTSARVRLPARTVRGSNSACARQRSASRLRGDLAPVLAVAGIAVLGEVLSVRLQIDPGRHPDPLFAFGDDRSRVANRCLLSAPRLTCVDQPHRTDRCGFTPNEQTPIAPGGLFVGARGFEPLTSSASRKRSPPELSARVPPDATRERRGGDRNRTGVRGFAGLCLTTRPPRRCVPARGGQSTRRRTNGRPKAAVHRSGRRDSNPRPPPWQGGALPTEPRPRGVHPC